MKNKIVDYFSDKDNGLTGIVIQNKYGHFYGGTKFNPKDNKDTFSSFAGSRYAEIRAGEKFARFRYKQEKIKLKAIQDLMNDIKRNCPEEIEKNPKLMRRINLKLRDYTQSVEDWDNLSNYLKESVSKQVEEREKILSRSNTIK